MAVKRESDDRRWRLKTMDLEMLEIGTPVTIQNQKGNNPTKWDKTGVVLENKPHSQVLIRVHGSRRVTTRNMRYVRCLGQVMKQDNPKSGVKPKEVPKDPDTDRSAGTVCGHEVSAGGDPTGGAEHYLHGDSGQVSRNMIAILPLLYMTWTMGCTRSRGGT